MHQAHAVENIDVAHTVSIGLHPVIDVECGFSEEHISTGILQLQQGALDRANRLGCDLAVSERILLRMLANVVDHSTQIFKIQKKQAVVVRNMENYIEDAFLHFRQSEYARKQHRTHFRNGRPNGNAVFAIHIPEAGRASVEFVIVDSERRKALHKLLGSFARYRNARNITLDVGKKHRDSGIAHGCRERFQRDGLAGTGGAGDETMPVGHLWEQADEIVRFCNLELSVNIHLTPFSRCSTPVFHCN